MAMNEASQPTFYTIVRGSGDRDQEHMDTDLSFKDSTGRIVLLARAQSAIGFRKNYTILDASANVLGYVETKGLLVKYTLTVFDSTRNILGYVQIGGTHDRGKTPKCSVQDANGGEIGRIAFTNNVYSLSLVRLDGFRIFDASMAPGGGLMARLSAFGRKAYSISLFDSSFPLLVLVAIFAAVNEYG